MEIGNDPTFLELKQFAANILEKGVVDGPDHLKWSKETEVRYLEALTQVLVAERFSKDLASLTDQLAESVRLASEASSQDARRALSAARHLTWATWGLFAATSALVYFTYVLANT